MTQNELNNLLIEKTKILHQLSETLQAQIASNREGLDTLFKMNEQYGKVLDLQARMNDDFNKRLEALEKK